jgi:SAM-dependent methyltransferase
LTSIEYAQADLLKLGTLGRSFDVIEAMGVLHHLADPFAGWRILLSLLRPGGFMRLGFYSEVARRNIVKVQAFIAAQGYGATADEIRRSRQQVMDLDKSATLAAVLSSRDFFSTSACRDLLFHVQERRMLLTGMDAFLRENNLTFLGFEIDDDVLHAYKRRFPDDPAATNLAQWQTFENENPDTFAGMYQLWIQRRVKSEPRLSAYGIFSGPGSARSASLCSRASCRRRKITTAAIRITAASPAPIQAYWVKRCDFFPR